MRRLFEDTDKKKTLYKLVFNTIQTTTILSQQNKGDIGTFKVPKIYSRARDFRNLEKKMPHKINVAASNGAQKK